VLRELGDLTRHLDARGAGADDGEREQLLASRLIARSLGLFERGQDSGPQLQRVIDRLHAGRELGEMVVAEVRLARAGSENQRVERRHIRVAEQLGRHFLVRQIDACDVAEQHLRVLLPTQDHPGRGRDLALRDDPGRDLVQQRLEQVVRGVRDHLDVDIGTLERLRRGQPAKTRANDDDSVLRCRRCGGSGVHAGSSAAQRLLAASTVAGQSPLVVRNACVIHHQGSTARKRQLTSALSACPVLATMPGE
jgi:hypothetical protein